jgi:hypothetical protein
LGTSTYAEKPKFDINLGVGTIRGDTTYQIGGSVEYADGTKERLHFPISELEFPLDVYMATLKSSIEFLQAWQINIDVHKSITKDSGKMKDSDWGYWYMDGCSYCSPYSLDIYSESDTELDAFMLGINFQHRFLKKSFKSID